jgi:cyclic pyranopterin phosphate synthase
VKDFTHIDKEGRPFMVDVGGKEESCRTAKAHGLIKLAQSTIKSINENRIKKGNVLRTAELAGIQAAKRTGELIPLCHSLCLTHVSVKAETKKSGVKINSEVRCIGRTGVEMEALTAVSIALLTVYDMCKAVDKNMQIGPVSLVEKKKEAL